MPEFILGARGHDFGRHDPETLFSSIGQAGFACTQLAFTKAVEGVKSYADGTPALVERARAAAAASGVGIAVDGKIGPATITAIRSLEDDGRLGDLLRAPAAERLYYYRTRPGWPVYGRGWQARTQRCFDTCVAMLGGE